MKVLDKGHKYSLKNNKTDGEVILTFYKDEIINGSGYDGTTNQEVLRCLIDRIKFLDKQLPHEVNSKIIQHLRSAIILHEQRHLDRLLDKGIDVENLKTFADSHTVVF